MSLTDWIVLGLTLLAIVVYGMWTAYRHSRISDYLRGGNDLSWGTIGLSVMATQASAITFLSTPGQGFENGLGFVQNYLGLPIALIIVSAFFLPIYHRLKVFTAYEFLGNRFDNKTRLLGAMLFLLQRGFAAGITIYAPAIILSTVFKWELNLTILITGILVIAYTVSGGTRTVSLTQKYQMLIILFGMTVAFGYVMASFPEGVSFSDAIFVAGQQGKLEAISFSLDPNERYTIWSGLLGGFFLALSYFGTDQSQVQRYIGGRSMEAGRYGLMFNAVLKIPMQFAILFLGAMLFAHYQFSQPPLFFNEAALEKVPAEVIQPIREAHAETFAQKREAVSGLIAAHKAQDLQSQDVFAGELSTFQTQMGMHKTELRAAMLAQDPKADVQDADYVFLHFVLNHLPHGLIGLLVAVIFSAAMSSTASELNALGSTTSVDIYQVFIRKDGTEAHNVRISRWLTLAWGIVAIGFAMTLTLFENLIEAVNIIGSVFYGTILGIFIVAFALKRIGANAVFIAAVLAELTVLALFFNTDIGYLWFNVIGCVLVIMLSSVFQLLIGGRDAR